MNHTIAYKRSKNLGDMLIRAKVSHRRRLTRPTNGFFACNRPCNLCAYGYHDSEHTCKRTGESWAINSRIDCVTTNVVYKLSCLKCDNFTYIGETSRRFCDRVAEHMGYISQKKLNHPVGKHFNLQGHQKTDLLPMTIRSYHRVIIL